MTRKSATLGPSEEEADVGKFISKILVAAVAALAVQAHALQIISESPQGEASRVRQIAAKFDEAAVNFGDPKAPAPFILNCSDAQAARGSGR